MNLFTIAKSDFDAIIGIIAVIGWIVAQVLSKRKGGDSPGTPPPTTPPMLDPQDELKKFFEEMEKTLKPAAPPPLPASPPPLRAESRPDQSKRVRVQRPAKCESEMTAGTTRGATAIPAPAAFRMPAIPLPDIPPLAFGLAHELRDPLALRKMIITMEVLGKPVALRTN